MIEMGQDLQLLAADLSKTDQELVWAPVVVDLVWPKAEIIDPSRSTTRVLIVLLTQPPTPGSTDSSTYSDRSVI